MFEFYCKKITDIYGFDFILVMFGIDRDPRIKFLYRYGGLKILVEAKGNDEIRISGVFEDV